MHLYTSKEAVSFEEFTTTNQQLLEIEDSFRKLTVEKSTLEKNYNNSIDELITVKNKLSEAEGVIDALNIQTNSAQSQINDLNASLTKKDQQIQSIIKDKKTLEDTISTNTKNLIIKNKLIEKLENKIAELGNNLGDLNEEILSLNTDLKNTVSENTKLIQSSNNKSDAISNLKIDLEKKDTRHKQTDESGQLAKSLNKNLQSSIDSLRSFR